MCSSLKEIEWDKPEVSISSFLTVILMPLTYSIGEGIACGFLAYVVLMSFKGKVKKVHPVMYDFIRIICNIFCSKIMNKTFYNNNCSLYN